MKEILFSISLLLGCVIMNAFADQYVKNPNVAGQFYTANPTKLAAQINSFLDSFSDERVPGHIDILIAPHAGYMYSGKIAARSFKEIQGKIYTTVVVLAPSHHYGFSGMSVWSKGGLRTPLGVLPVDEEFAARLIDQDPLFVDDPKVFDLEHSLEVELPFIQTVLPKAKIVPVIMGQASFETCQKAAAALDRLIGDRNDVLVVVSSDMSHFHDDQTARTMDGATLKIIESFDARQMWQQCAVRRLEMCGFVPVTTAMLLAKERGLQVKVLMYGNSGDVTGDKSNVVGYSSVVFYRAGQQAASGTGVGSLTLEQKRRLIDIAKKAIDLSVREGKTLKVDEKDPRLNEVEGAFVTIHKQGHLRGCIGNIIGRQALYLTVRDMAIAASSSDPRFSPVSPEELKDLEIDISVLSKPWRAKNPDEIEMGVHGVILKRGWHSGVFLPQVATETGWDREAFLSQLCSQKAGLPADCWKDPATQLNIFTATVFSEKDIAE